MTNQVVSHHLPAAHLQTLLGVSLTSSNHPPPPRISILGCRAPLHPSPRPYLIFLGGFNNSLQWFSPRRHRCNNPGHHWKASSMCAEEISAVAPQTQICDALSHWVQINFIFLLPPLSWIPPRTQNKSRGGCRPQADSFTFGEAWFIEPFCTCAVGLVAVSLGRHQRAHRAAAACTHNQSFVWVITAADLPGRLLQWCGSFMSLEVQPFRGQSMSSWLRAWWEKNVRVCTKTTRREVLYALKYIRWVE